MRPEHLMQIILLMPHDANVMHCPACDVYWAHRPQANNLTTRCWNCNSIGMIIAQGIISDGLPFP